jgi:hypothetical protein
MLGLLGFRFVSNRNQPLGIGAVFVSIQIPVKGHVNEPDLLQPVPQFLPGIDGMVKREMFHPALPDQEPCVPNTGPLIENLVLLHQCRPVRQTVGGGGLKNAGETFFPHHI